MSIEIRSSRLDDAAAIATVHVDSWRAAYRGHVPGQVLDSLDVSERTERWSCYLQSAELSVFVATAAGVVVGFCAVRSSRDEDASKATGEIPTLYVSPDFWRKGLGRKLMDRALVVAWERGFTEMTLWVLASNARAQAFYEQCGFRRDGHTKVDISLTGTPLNEVRYRITKSGGVAKHR